jgi:hypothetical protein
VTPTEVIEFFCKKHLEEVLEKKHKVCGAFPNSSTTGAIGPETFN